MSLTINVVLQGTCNTTHLDVMRDKKIDDRSVLVYIVTDHTEKSVIYASTQYNNHLTKLTL